MSDVTVSMKLSPKAAGALFSKACRLEDENEQLRARVAELESCLSIAIQVLSDQGAVGSIMGRFRKALRDESEKQEQGHE